MEQSAVVARWIRTAIGLGLVLLSAAPLYRLAGHPDGGLAGSATVDIVGTHTSFLWSGAFVLALVALLAGLLLDHDVWARPWRRIESGLLRLGPTWFALAVGAVGFTATAAFTLLVLGGRPNLIDAMAQLVQARYMAEGHLGGPVLEDPGFWFIQNTVLTAQGWVSQYPPGHTALLALGLRLGLVEMLGGIFVAITAAFTYLSLRRLLPGEELVARLSGLGVGLSPFLISQSGSYMNHGSAAALSVLGVYFALRARDGRVGWGLALGAALGFLFTSRPLFALVIAFGVVAPIAGLAVRRSDLSPKAALGRVGLGVVGGAPLLALFLLYNAHFFGSPFELGYVAAWGDAHGLGFHTDPWGNLYSPLAAIAYTSADLTALSLSLFETPLPLVALVGLWLLLARRLPRGQGVVVAWGLMPVVANFFYWHHGYFMGPRMLAEAVPAWIGLVVLAVTWLVRRSPERLGGDGPRFNPRASLVTGLVIAGLAAAYLGPLRLINRGGEFHPSTRIEPPTPPAPALVFVHGGWSGRVFGRLAGEGLAMFALETALRQNDLCHLHQTLEQRPFRSGALDLELRPTTAGLVDVEVFPGNTMTFHRSRLDPGGPLRLPGTCRRDMLADRHGILALAPLLWRGGLPGLEGESPLYARDLGPERNDVLRDRHPDRSHYLLIRDSLSGAPLVLPYDAGRERVWSDDFRSGASAPILPAQDHRSPLP